MNPNEMSKTPLRADGIEIHCAHTRLADIDSLVPNPRNPNTHPNKQIEIFAKVVQTLGWRAPIVISKRSGFIIKGHGKLAVAKHLKLRTVPIDEQNYADEAAEWQDLIADNRIAELSERDDAEIAKLLAELNAAGNDTTATGYNNKEMTSLLARIKKAALKTEADAPVDRALALLDKWKVEPGQIWQLGEHRIACGDATNAEIWERLMEGRKAQLVHTDPPYSVDYENAAGTTIQGDTLQRDQMAALVRDSLKLAAAHTIDAGSFYVWHASSTRRDFEFALDQAGLSEKQYLTWVKESFVLGRADYHWQTEPCFYCEKAGFRAKWYGDRAQATVWRLTAQPTGDTAVAIANGLLITDGGNGELFIRASKPKTSKARHLRVTPGKTLLIADRAQTNAWEIARDDRATYLHPTQKPVELAAIAVRNSSEEGDLVIDMFSGSASTLLACERLKRRARVIDIEPKFVAVALERWSEATGATPCLKN